MTSPARVFAILDLFTQERLIWHTDEINDALGYARPTGYRHEAHAAEIAKAGMGKTWADFRAALTAIRKAGYYLSPGELELSLGSVSVLVFNGDDECVAALALVGQAERVFGRLPSSGAGEPPPQPSPGGGE